MKINVFIVFSIKYLDQTDEKHYKKEVQRVPKREQKTYIYIAMGGGLLYIPDGKCPKSSITFPYYGRLGHAKVSQFHLRFLKNNVLLALTKTITWNDFQMSWKA